MISRWLNVSIKDRQQRPNSSVCRLNHARGDGHDGTRDGHGGTGDKDEDEDGWRRQGLNEDEDSWRRGLDEDKDEDGSDQRLPVLKGL